MHDHSNGAQLTTAFLHEMLRRMLRIRLFEDHCANVASELQVRGACHLSIGQEGEIVGACMALRRDDYMTGNHRSHGHPIAKGASLAPLMAELYGKATGVCRAKGGSMHLADFSVGSLGESGIVGSLIPVAVGAGLSAQLRRTDQVSLCFFGDGAANCGPFHESINLAAVWKLPVVFLCENNGYATTVPQAYSTSVADIANRASAYDISGVIVDGQDVLATYQTVSNAIQHARTGNGPTLVEAKTYRYCEHGQVAGRERCLPYRSKEEIDRWRTRDPIAMFSARLISDGSLTEPEFAAMRSEVRAEIDAAVDFAVRSPFPGPKALTDDLFA